jgi:hypothetical protein
MYPFLEVSIGHSPNKAKTTENIQRWKYPTTIISNITTVNAPNANMLAISLPEKD